MSLRKYRVIHRRAEKTWWRKRLFALLASYSRECSTRQIGSKAKSLSLRRDSKRQSGPGKMSCDEATLTLFFSNVHNGPLRQRIQRDNNDEVEWFLKHTKPQYDIFSFPTQKKSPVIHWNFPTLTIIYKPRQHCCINVPNYIRSHFGIDLEFGDQVKYSQRLYDFIGILAKVVRVSEEVWVSCFKSTCSIKSLVIPETKLHFSTLFAAAVGWKSCLGSRAWWWREEASGGFRLTAKRSRE